MSTAAEVEWVVANVPSGHPDPASTFKLQPISSPPTAATPGHVLLRLRVISVDPYLRDVLRKASVGQPQYSWCVAEVVDSQLDGYSVGEFVTGALAWKTLQLHDGKLKPGQKSSQGTALRKVVPVPGVPLTAWVGVLGMPGRTAYFGLLDPEVGGLKADQTVVVSGAAGAVGSMVGQLARMKGAKKVIGTAGGPDKCRLVSDKYGFDACLDYKELDTVERMQQALKEAAPDGVQVYFDNVGGHVTQAMWPVYADHGRMVLCGAISGYNKDPKDNLIPNPFNFTMIYGALSVRAMRVNDYADRVEEFYTEVVPLVQHGKLRFDETVYKGFDKVPEAFAGLFLGHNTGKAVITID